VDYPALAAYTRRLHRLPGVAETVRFDHIKLHYYDQIGDIDPTIVPAGPASDYTDAEADEPNDDYLQEVFDLHGYLEDWLKGNVADHARGPTRLDRCLAGDFVVIHPDGRREDKADVLRSFAAAYGAKPRTYALEITEPSIRPLHHGLFLATYREAHRGEPGRARISSALLRRSANRTVEWLFLQETSVADSVAPISAAVT